MGAVIKSHSRGKNSWVSVNPQSIPFSVWFNRNAQIPMLFVVAIVLLLQTLWIIRWISDEQQRLSDIKQQLLGSLGVAVAQQNRGLAETSISAARIYIGASTIALCYFDKAVLSIPWSSKACSINKSSSFATTIEKTSLIGVNGYEIEIIESRWKWIATRAMAIFPSILMVIASVLILQRIRKKLGQEVVLPLEQELSKIGREGAENDTTIHEIRSLFSAYREKIIEVTTLSDKYVLQEKEAALGRISAQICHDLKSPLMGIEVAAGARSWEEFTGMRHGLLSALNKLHAMIDNLRRSDVAGLVRTTISKFEPDILLESALSMLKSRDMKMQVSFENLVINETKLKLDSEKVERAISNLVLNAVECGASLIIIVMRRFNNNFSIEISNNGPQVPPEILPRLFQRGATYGKSGGTGLGLAFVASVMHGHEGDVQHKYDAGLTTFVLNFSDCIAGNFVKSEQDVVTPGLLLPLSNAQEPPPKSKCLGIALDNTAFASKLSATLISLDPTIEVIVVNHDNLHRCMLLCSDDPEFATDARLKGIAVFLILDHKNVNDVAERLVAGINTRKDKA